MRLRTSLFLMAFGTALIAFALLLMRDLRRPA